MRMTMDRDLDTLADQVVGRVSDAVVSELQKVRASSGLSFSQILVVTLLRREGPLRLGQIASHLGITSGSATPLIDGLAKRGAVERNPDPSDRRAVLVSLSAPAQEQVDLTQAGWRVIVGELLARLRRESIDDLLRAVESLGLLENGDTLRALDDAKRNA